MVSKSFIVKNIYGIHARPARLIVETASKFTSQINLSKNDEEIDAKSIMGILMLEASKGSELVLRITGEDEEDALQELEMVFKNITSIDGSSNL
jgi:phosphocarrier protein HPr